MKSNWNYILRVHTYVEMMNLEERIGKESHPRGPFQIPLYTLQLRHEMRISAYAIMNIFIILPK